ncbi:MAG: ribonuclease H-like YkuK family protein [Patescibacteria group bacterium]|nr:ribonuclease H-like YkuK family protein [Patescibacteria group bacterium]
MRMIMLARNVRAFLLTLALSLEYSGDAMQDFFNSSLGMNLSVPQVVREVIRFMKEDETRAYKVIIGTDSERLPENKADFVTAIVVHRIGNGGRYFWKRVEHASIHTLRNRIIKEALMSLDIAKEVLMELKAASAPEFGFEIHVDVGEHGPTKVMIQEVVGMVRAHNFEAKTKPESYAASNVADRHV